MENKRSKKVIALLVTFALCLLILSCYLVTTKYLIYIAISLLLLIFDLILLIIYLNNTKSEHAKYESDLKYILRTFDSVLAYMDSKIKLKGKEVIRLESFEDLVNCQEEIKKPILYSYNETSAVFLLIDKKTIFFTTLKENDKYTHPFELELINKMNSNIDEPDDTILEDIDKTTIIQTKSNKKYKVSPVREKKENDISDTQIMSFMKDEFFPKIKDK